jgi:hypothetical protein
VRMIRLEAATPESGRALYSALAAFHPEFETDEEGICFVSVSFNDENHMLEVLGAIQKHLEGRGDAIASWMTSAAEPDRDSSTRTA